MTETRPLAGKRILVLEDDYYLARDEQALLERAGATVVGPYGRGTESERLASAGTLDGAVVDINLGHGPNFDAARLLESRRVPMVFVTGYDAAVVPDDLAHIPRVEKPVRERDLLAAMAGLLGR